MEITHKLETIDGKEQLVLYVNYPDEYEFGLDFDSIKKNVAKVSDKIREYAFKAIGNMSNETALIVLNGVIIGSLAVTGLVAAKNENINKAQVQVEASISSQVPPAVEQSLNVNNVDTRVEEEKPEVVQTASVEQPTTTTSNTTTVQKTSAPTNNTSSKTSSNSSSNSSNNNTSSTSLGGQTVNLKLSSGSTIKIALEDYIVGVVSAEMPISFNSEALKAQAVAARTYAMKKTAAGATLSATTSDQVYKTESELKTLWGNSFTTNYNKVKGAVSATAGKTIKYNGAYIDAVYFSTSNGKTEDSVNVWGNSLPYLKSVDSKWDVGVSNFTSTKSIPMSTISSKLGVNITSASQIVIGSKTIGDRVKNVTVNGKTFTGVQIRTLLGLKSADFTVRQDGSNIVFTTKGYGHGVGMSQYGANGMANASYSYIQILQHYYTGVTIQ